MTLKKFLEALAQTPKRGWHIDDLGGLRYAKKRRNGRWGLELCPIEVVGKATEEDSYHECADALKLSGKLRSNIVAAADHDEGPKARLALRRKMLAVTINRPPRKK